MHRSDYIWLGLRGGSLFFLIKSILLLPALIHLLRVKDAVLGPGASSEPFGAFPSLFFGTAGLTTHIVVYVCAALALLLVPVRDARPAPA